MLGGLIVDSDPMSRCGAAVAAENELERPTPSGGEQLAFRQANTAAKRSTVRREVVPLDISHLNM